MPMKIECPDCANWPGMVKLCKTCKGTGQITVYTKAELDEAEKEERERCAKVVEDYVYKNMRLKNAWVGGPIAESIRNMEDK